MDAKISIIVPVYNVAEYIGKCIESILGQTYENIELICVNDGSTDSSLEILKSYEKSDSRVVVIDKKNEGVSSARNDGIAKSTGEYVMFVDGDDWIDPDMCRRMIDAEQRTNADTVICCYMKEYPNSSIPVYLFDKDILFSGCEFKDKIYRRLFGLKGEELKHPELADSLVPVWAKLFKRRYIKTVKFVDLTLIGTAEDLVFLVEAYKSCGSAFYLNVPLYHYRRNAGSVTSVYKPGLFEKREYMFEMLSNIIEKNNLSSEFAKALSNRVALNIIGLGLNVCSSDEDIFKKAKSLKKILDNKRYRDSFEKLDFSYFPVHWKLFFGLCKYRLALPLVLMIYAIGFLRKRQ